MSDLGQSVTEGFVVRALVLAWAAITNTTGWAASTTEFISHGSKGRKIQDQDPAQSGSGEGSLPSLQMAAFSLCPRMAVCGWGWGSMQVSTSSLLSLL